VGQAKHGSTISVICVEFIGVELWSGQDHERDPKTKELVKGVRQLGRSQLPPRYECRSVNHAIFRTPPASAGC